MGEGPDGKFSGSTVHVQHAPYHVGDKRGIYNGLQGIPASESIPKGEGGVVGFPASVFHEVWTYECMVETGVELRCRAAGHFHGAKDAVPGFPGLRKDRVKTPAVCFGLEVKPGSVYSGVGNAGIYRYLVGAFGKAE